MKKRWLPLFLALCVALMLLPTTALAEEEVVDVEEAYVEELFEDEYWSDESWEDEEIDFINPFPDVPNDADYLEAVAYLTDTGIITGDGNGNFNPNAAITRAEVSAIVCRLMGVESEAKSIHHQVYDDVDSANWAAGYITKATELGVFNGDGTGNFRPTDNVTYEQIIKILVCACGYESEAQRNGGWPNGYVGVAADLGITSGVRFSQTANAPRSAVAQLIYNLVQF